MKNARAGLDLNPRPIVHQSSGARTTTTLPTISFHAYKYEWLSTVVHYPVVCLATSYFLMTQQEEKNTTSFIPSPQPQGHSLRYHHIICLDVKYLAPFLWIPNSTQRCHIFGGKKNSVIVPLTNLIPTIRTGGRRLRKWAVKLKRGNSTKKKRKQMTSQTWCVELNFILWSKILLFHTTQAR